MNVILDIDERFFPRKAPHGFGYIYKLTNLSDGKSYIGQTKTDIKNRYYAHLKPQSNNTKISKAIQKEGKNNFKLSIIGICLVKDLDKIEILEIKKHNSIKDGYNIREGGSRGKLSEETKKKISLSNKGKHFGQRPEETRLKISKSQKGRIIPQIVRDKISNSLKGEKHPFFGKSPSHESRLKMSIAQTGKIKSKETKDKISASIKASNLKKKLLIKENYL